MDSHAHSRCHTPCFHYDVRQCTDLKLKNGHGGTGSLTIGCGPDCPQVYHRKFPSHCTAVVHGLSQPKSMFQNLSLVITTSFRISSIPLTASLQNKLCKKKCPSSPEPCTREEVIKEYILHMEDDSRMAVCEVSEWQTFLFSYNWL